MGATDAEGQTKSLLSLKRRPQQIPTEIEAYAGRMPPRAENSTRRGCDACSSGSRLRNETIANGSIESSIRRGVKSER